MLAGTGLHSAANRSSFGIPEVVLKARGDWATIGHRQPDSQ